MTTLRRRVERLERRQLTPRPSHSIQFDEDALAIYTAVLHLDGTMTPTYHDVEPTAAYMRGQELRDSLYGPIIPAHLDEHLKRYTRASGEFELAFGREPKAGDMLRYQHLALMHSSENYSCCFTHITEAWQRQLPQLTCPLKFEGSKLFRRLRPEKCSGSEKWEEDVGIQPEMRWLEIPEVISNTDLETMLTIPALVFLGVVGVKHQCRPATDEELRRPEAESLIKTPTGFMFGRQRFYEFLVEVMGA
jgi:hypothetical protein